MAYYLVYARPKQNSLEELEEKLKRGDFLDMRPFGKTLSFSLQKAKIAEEGLAVWEEEDYCTPPLAEERSAVLDKYFDQIEVMPVPHKAGWQQIDHLPPLFPEIIEQSQQRF